jgi:hypothetical protein
MEGDFDHLVYSKNVIEFVTVAREYCTWLENTLQLPRRDFIETGVKLLPLLYLKTVVLPKPSPMLKEDFLDKSVTEGEYQHLLNTLLVKMGPHNDYLEVFTADMQNSVEPLTASIAENLTDIYQDLKDFLSSYRTAVTEIMNDALCELLNNFELFWGQRLVNVLRALHQLLFGGEDLDEDADEKSPSEEERNTEDWLISRMQKNWQASSQKDELEE